jgi:hypothetical protein
MPWLGTSSVSSFCGAILNISSGSFHTFLWGFLLAGTVFVLAVVVVRFKSFAAPDNMSLGL